MSGPCRGISKITNKGTVKNSIDFSINTLRLSRKIMGPLKKRAKKVRTRVKRGFHVFFELKQNQARRKERRILT